MVAITAAFIFVVKDFLMTIFVAAIFSGLAHPLYARLLRAFGGREALASVVTLADHRAAGRRTAACSSCRWSPAKRSGMTDNVTPWVTADRSTNRCG